MHVLYCHDYARVFYLRSDDDGATFSPVVEITSVFEAFRRDYPWRVVATGPGHGTQLRNGRLVVPVWLEPAKFQLGASAVAPPDPSVLMAITLQEDGSVSEAHPLAGPEFLYPACRAAALKCRFEPLARHGLKGPLPYKMYFRITLLPY